MGDSRYRTQSLRLRRLRFTARTGTTELTLPSFLGPGYMEVADPERMGLGLSTSCWRFLKKFPVIFQKVA